MFTLTGLAPLTSYTFEIQALNSNFPPSLPLRGPRASLTVSTTAPEGKLLVTLSYRVKLLEEDTGSYNCLAMIASTQANVVSSDSRSISESIEVRG